MIRQIKQFITIIGLAALLDGAYFSFFGSYFGSVLKSIQGSPMRLNVYYAALCYVLIAFSIFYFRVIQGLSILNMFILGTCIYGIYELTNAATFKNWPLFMVVVDSLWGGILYSSVAYLLKVLL
jgi:uncharacterized membrane protein